MNMRMLCSCLLQTALAITIIIRGDNMLLEACEAAQHFVARVPESNRATLTRDPRRRRPRAPSIEGPHTCQARFMTQDAIIENM